jgi:hypothetical protein
LGDYFDRLIVTLAVALTYARSVTLLCNASTRFAILEGTAHPWRLARIIILWGVMPNFLAISE